MRVSRILILLILVLAGFTYLNHRATSSVDEDRYREYVGGRAADIERTLNDMLAYGNGVCVFAGPFPYDSREKRDYGGSNCDRCDDLAEAGFLTKSVFEYGEHGTHKLATTYTLTKAGRSIYFERDERGARPYRMARLCFGETVLHRIDEALAPANMGGNVYVGVKYTTEVRDPHPYLYDPGAAALGLQTPSVGKPALFPPRITTIVFYPGGDVDIEDGVRYGKYVKK
jgi:hypothetical protein